MAGSPRRTPEELKDPQFNYYIAFDFEITETNSKVIEEAVKKKLSSATGSLRGRRMLELKNDILEVMCNDAKFDGNSYVPKKGGRKEEAEHAVEFKLEEAVEIIQDMCAKSGRKFILFSDLENIRTKAKRYFSVDDLKKRIDYLQQQGVKIIDNVDKTMPFNEYKKVEENLSKAKKRDLYDFLGVPPNATADQISKAHDATYSSGTKTNDLALKQAVSGLCASVKMLLLNKEAKYRKNYDYYLKLKDSVWSKLELRKVYGMNLSMEEYEEFVQITVDALSVAIDEAERILAVGCKYYSIFVSGKEGESNFDTCPYCNRIYKKGAKSCPHCAKPLEIVCWNCSGRMAYSKTNQTCPSCGVTKQTEETFRKKAEAMDSVLRLPQSDIPKLEMAYVDLCNVIPNYSTKPDSVACKRIRGYADAIKERKSVEEKMGKAYRDDEGKVRKLIIEKKYYTAEGLAKTLKSKYGTYNADNTAKVIAAISAEIAKVQQVLNIAKAAVAKNDTKTAIANATKAVDMCEDCMDARAVLQKFPPAAPTSVRSSVSGNAVKIDWTVVAGQENVSYTVIKKVGVRPSGPDDGSVVAENLSINFLEDQGVVPATKYFYAIFANRCGIKSPIVVTQAPLIFADVTQVHQEVVNDCIKVTWKAPENVKEIKVYKNKGSIAPDKPGAGEAVACDMNGFTDSKVSGDNAYLIVCEYRVDGATQYSRGLRSVFRPYRILNEIKNPEIKCAGGNQYVFTGDADGNTVALYYTESKLSLPYKKTQRLTDFGTVAKGLIKLPMSVNLDSNTVVNLPDNKIGWLYPVAQNDQLFIVSEPLIFNTVKGQNIKYEMLAGTLVITGSVSDKAENIVLKVSSKDFPKSMDDDGECFRYKRSDFARDGKIELKLKANTLSYVSVFAEFKMSGIVSYSQPYIFDEALGEMEKVTVRYKLDYAVSPTKPFKINVTFEADSEITVPALLLMKGRPRPLNKTEGELVERLEPIPLKKGMFSKGRYTGKCTVKVPPAAMNMKYIIFVADDKSGVKLREVLTL